MTDGQIVRLLKKIMNEKFLVCSLVDFSVVVLLLDLLTVFRLRHYPHRKILKPIVSPFLTWDKITINKNFYNAN